MKLPNWVSSSEYRFYGGIATLGILAIFIGKGYVNQEKIEKNVEKIQPDRVVKSSPINAYTSDIQKINRTPQAQPSIETSQKPVNAPTAPIDIFTSSVEEIGEVYAPSRRLIKCKLVNSIQSNNIQTPIIGMVIEDVWHNGQLIIPAGTEIHGMASGTSNSDRIASGNDWRFIWRNFPAPESGWELPITGIALDYVPLEMNPEDLNDGSAGLRGRVIENSETQLLGAIFAKAIAGFGEGISKEVSVASGGSSVSTTTGDFKSAVGQTLKQAADLTAQLYIQRLQQNASYVRVHGGKTFYFYNYDPIDLAKARIGAAKPVK